MMKAIAKMLGKKKEKAGHHANFHATPITKLLEKKKEKAGHLANFHATPKTWRALSGEDNWEGLLDPLNNDLRRLIIHYGDMIQATYDTFIRQKESRFAGDSRYGERDLFAKVGLEKGNPFPYSVTKFFYATSEVEIPEAFFIKSLSREAWSRESNWMGYISVATDEGAALLGRRDIVITWRGTKEAMEWLDDFEFILVSAPKILGEDNGGSKIHQGFYSIYTSSDPHSQYCVKSAREQITEEIRRLVEKYKGEEISITVIGHSLGASLATLTAFDIAANGLNDGHLVTAIVLASPRVGDSHFKKLFSETANLRALRVHNAGDIVPDYPPLGYSDVGEEIKIDSSKSNYLKAAGQLDFSKKHNLQVYLHMIAGTEGPDGRFELVINRDIALANRSEDILKEEFLIPAGWWAVQNKGMVQQDDGSWKLMDHEANKDETVDKQRVIL